MIYGHKNLIEALEQDLPPVSLFLGPSSVGKRATAEHLAKHHGVAEIDMLRINHLSMDAARDVVAFAAFQSSTQAGRLAIIQLDSAYAPALHVLLKTLEDGVGSTRFILIAKERPLETIVSRSTVYWFGLLKDDELAAVLTEVRGFKQEAAERLSKKAGGQVSRAFDFAVGHEQKPVVLQAVRAFREHDPAVLEKLADRWNDDATQLLSEWCTEQITGRWRIFDDAETEIIGRDLPLKILSALKLDIRPRLVVRFSLMSILRSM